MIKLTEGKTQGAMRSFNKKAPPPPPSPDSSAIELFVLCMKEIKLHQKTAFHRGHVYIVEKRGYVYYLQSDSNSREVFPQSYFSEYFKVIFPVMENLK